MIYSRFGSALQIIGNCGEHLLSDFPNPVTLVRVDYVDRAEISYQFAHALKADGGSAEIDAAVNAARKVNLTDLGFRDALRHAR